MLNKLPFFKGCKKEGQHHFYYSMSYITYDKDFIIFSPGEDLYKLYLLMNGVLEFVTYFDGNEFVLERVYGGSIINYRNFFMDDEAQVYCRVLRTSFVCEIHVSEVNVIKDLHPDFEKKFVSY